MACSAVTFAQNRKVISLNEGWQFSRDKAQWETVNIPHDWAIQGPFDKKWDRQFVAIEQNGEKEKTEKTGRSGALPWIGKGYYKKTLRIPQGYRHAILMIDGAMSDPHVYVNGQLAGFWPYGYNAFNIDIAPYAKMDGSENTIEIELDNVEESSRWYPGGGIYRPVRLLLTGEERFDTWETYARTVSADTETAAVEVSAKIAGLDTERKHGTEIELYDKRGQLVAASHVVAQQDGSIFTTLHVKRPQLWSPETPYLYRLKLSHYSDRKLMDSETLSVGIRTVSATKDGFKLNGVTRKIKGVCLHHDLGPLGAAENKAALIRQIETMKAMGCDAIRTAHNMPSTMQMELCDSLGMMVMAESFDMWEYAKCKNGYARFFKEWGDKDIRNLVLHHRNHPSIIMWSIGNEIPEQWSAHGTEIAKRLQDICHRYDPSRPVTQGMDRAEAALKSGFAQAMDVPGFNYRVHKYPNNIKQLPQGFLLASETASTVSSRGIYKFPAEVSNSKTYPDGQCSSYDTEYCSWSNLPDDDWKAQEDLSYVIGEFVWTGYDYLGEPTPYDTYWPSRSSYFGICDLAGLPKDRYYLYRSHWNKSEHTVHLLPHWTWPGREGKVTPVYCYTDGTEAELFVNGKSQGRIKKDPQQRLDRFRLRWNDVKYEPGEIRVVAYDANGKVIGEQTVKTAGKPSTIHLEAECLQYKPQPDWTKGGKTTAHDRIEAARASKAQPCLKADGNDLAFVSVSLEDAQGNFCPTLSDDMSFEVSGAGTFEAVCNGDATSLEPFKQPKMKLFSGRLVVIVRSGQVPGTLTLKVTDKTRKLTQAIDIPVK